MGWLDQFGLAHGRRMPEAADHVRDGLAGPVPTPPTAEPPQSAADPSPSEEDPLDALRAALAEPDLPVLARPPDRHAASAFDAPRHRSEPERTTLMSTDIAATADIPGFIGAALVDSESGLMLASEGGGKLDMEMAAALNTQVIKAKQQAIEALGLDDGIEDILITLGRQIHLLRPLEKAPSVFLYVALDKKGANLGMARMQVKRIESGLSL